MSQEQYAEDRRHALMSGMSDGAASRYAQRLQAHPSRGGGALLAKLDRASHVGALDEWAAVHELGAVHAQHRRNMSTAESLFQIVLTARDSLDLESGWFATADEARAAMVSALNAKVCKTCDGYGRVSVRIKNEAGEDDDTEVACEDCAGLHLVDAEQEASPPVVGDGSVDDAQTIRDLLDVRRSLRNALGKAETELDHYRDKKRDGDQREASLLDDIKELTAERDELKSRSDELGELDEVVLGLGGQREQGPANFMANLSHERDELKRQLADERLQANQWLADKHDLEGETMTLTSERDTARMTQDELKHDLAWERGWDLWRKAAMGAVVEAARAWFKTVTYSSEEFAARVPLAKALSALDQAAPTPEPVEPMPGQG